VQVCSQTFADIVLHYILMKSTPYVSVGELSSVFLLFLNNTAEYFKLSLMLQISIGVSSFSLHFSLSLGYFFSFSVCKEDRK